MLGIFYWECLLASFGATMIFDLSHNCFYLLLECCHVVMMTKVTITGFLTRMRKDVCIHLEFFMILLLVIEWQIILPGS